MDEEIVEKFAHLERKIQKLEIELKEAYSKLDKHVKAGDEAFGTYLDNHRKEHAEMSKMLWPAYAKTHPQVMDTLIHCDKILGVPATDGSDPQP